MLNKMSPKKYQRSNLVNIQCMTIVTLKWPGSQSTSNNKQNKWEMFNNNPSAISYNIGNCQSGIKTDCLDIKALQWLHKRFVKKKSMIIAMDM